MSWSAATRARATAIQSQLFVVTDWARTSGADADVKEMLLEPYRKMLERIYVRDLSLARLADEADLLLHLKGPAVSAPTPRVSLVAKVLTSMRDEMARVVRQLAGVTTLRLPPELDMSLVGLAQGSLFVGLSVDKKPESDSARDAINTIGIVSELVVNDASIADLAARVEDPAVRDTAVAVVRHISPSGQMGITEIDLLGRSIPKKVSLTTDTRRFARRIMAERPSTATLQKGTFLGTVREVDLDASRFEIRDVEGQPGGIRCAHELDESEVKALVDKRVRVAGTAEYGKSNDVRLLWVEEVEEIGP